MMSNPNDLTAHVRELWESGHKLLALCVARYYMLRDHETTDKPWLKSKSYIHLALSPFGTFVASKETDAFFERDGKQWP